MASLIAIGKHLGGFQDRVEVDDVTPSAKAIPLLGDKELAPGRAAIEVVKQAARRCAEGEGGAPWLTRAVEVLLALQDRQRSGRASAHLPDQPPAAPVGTPLIHPTRLRTGKYWVEARGGRWYYNTIVVADPVQKNDPRAYASAGALSGEPGETLLTGVSTFIRRAFRRVNPDTVSTVVDADGRPLVVYHGTTSDCYEKPTLARKFSGEDPMNRGNATE